MARAQRRRDAAAPSRGLIAAVAMFSVAAACVVTGADATFHVSSELGGDLPASVGARGGSHGRVATQGETHGDHPAAVAPHGDDCAMMKLVVDFAQHHGRQAVHARFDVRAIHHDAVPDGVQDHLGSLLGSSSSEGPVTVEAKMCLPRDQGYVLVASGNATRGSSFNRFNVTVINEEYLGLVAFRAGSDWTRGSSFRSDRLAAAAETSATLGVMATEDPHANDYEVEFFEDEGVGPPLFESIDGGKTYRLHGRARFDVWPEAPIDANGVWTECGVLAAVSVGATSYGNGAAPRDMSWALWDKSDVDDAGRPKGDPLVAAGGDSFTWGSTMTAVACLQPGAYDLVAEDGGDLNRGWGFGTSVNVVEVVVDAKDKSMREKKIADVDAPTWFTSGRRKALTFDVDASAGVVEAAARARIHVDPEPAPEESPEEEVVEIETHDTVVKDDGYGEEENFVTEPTVVDAIDEVRTAEAKLAQPENSNSNANAGTDWSKYASDSGRKGVVTGGMAWASLGKAPRRKLLASDDVVGQTSDKNAFQTASVAAMAVAAVAAGVAHLAHASKRQRTLRFGAASVAAAVVDPEKQALLPNRLKFSAAVRGQRTSPAMAPLLAVAAVCGLIAFSGPSITSAPFGTSARLGDAVADAAKVLAAREAAALAGEPGLPLCGAGVDHCHLLSPADCRGRVFAYKPGVLAHMQGGVQTADVLAPMGAVSVDGSNQGFSVIDQNPGACEHRVNIGSDKAAKGVTCVRAVGHFEHSVTLEGCVKSCRETPGCEWYHAYRTTGSAEGGAFDECRLCAGGGEGVWAGPKDGSDVVSVHGPAWCLTNHNLTAHATGTKPSVQQCRAACDATEGCDAFNYGDKKGECTLLRLGADAKRSAVWRGSGFSPLGVTGYATYYAVSHAEVADAVGEAATLGGHAHDGHKVEGSESEKSDPEDWTQAPPVESRRLVHGAADTRCVAHDSRVKPGENLARGKPTVPLEAASVVDGVASDEKGADPKSCPVVNKGLSAAGAADQSVEIDLRGSFTLGALSVFALAGDAAALAGVDRSALLGAAKVPASALISAVNEFDGVERTCGEIIPGAGEATPNAVELFNVRGCEGFVATHVRVESARAGAVTHLCEVLAHAARQPAMTKFPTLPKWLELREETRVAMEEAAAEFVKGHADDSMIINRMEVDDSQTETARKSEPFVTGEDAKAKIEALETSGDDEGAAAAHHAHHVANVPGHELHEQHLEEEADALKQTEDAIEAQEKQRLHSYQKDVAEPKRTSDDFSHKDDDDVKVTNSAYHHDADAEPVPEDAMNLISEHFAVPKTIESPYDVDEAAAEKEKRAMAPGPSPAHVPFSDRAVPDEDRAGHHEPQEHQAAGHHHWPPVPTGTFSAAGPTPAPVQQVQQVQPELVQQVERKPQVVSPEVDENSCEFVCEGHGFNKDQCDAIPGCEFGEDANCWSAVGPNPCPSQAEWELYVSKHPKSVPKEDFIEVVTSLDNCEKVCEGHGFDAKQCLAVPGCAFNAEESDCYSAVGPNPCPSLLEWNFWHQHAQDHIFHDDHGHGEYKEEYNQEFIEQHPEYADHAVHDEHTDFHPYEIIDQMAHEHDHDEQHDESHHMDVEPNPELHEDADGEVHMYHVDESLDEHYADDLEGHGVHVEDHHDDHHRDDVHEEDHEFDSIEHPAHTAEEEEAHILHAQTHDATMHPDEHEQSTHEEQHEEPYRPDPIHTHAEHLENEDNHVAHEEVMNVPIETEATASMKAEVTTAAIPTHHTEEDVEDIHADEPAHRVGPVEITETTHRTDAEDSTEKVEEPVVPSEVPLVHPTTAHAAVPDIVEVHGAGATDAAPVAVPDEEAAPFPELDGDAAYNPRPAPSFPPGQSATLHDLQFVTCPGPKQCDKPPCVPYVHDLLEAHLVESAESCCQADDQWEYGNPRRFPHVCGQCSRNEKEHYMTYDKAEAFCAAKGGGLCRNNQVTVAGRADHCALDPDSVVWTDKVCDRGKGRAAVKLNGDYSHCVSDLEEKLPVVCCANTCEGFVPKRMCPHVAA